MARKLDRSRSFGQQCPEGAQGVFYFQDGYCFDQDGNELVNHPLQQAKKAPAPSTPAPSPQAPTGHAENLVPGSGVQSETMLDEPTLTGGEWQNWGPFDPNMQWPEAQKLVKRLKAAGAPVAKPVRSRVAFAEMLEDLGLMG